MPNTHSTLTALFTDIANAIRTKKGTSSTIIADNFPSEISSITTPSDYVQCIGRQNNMPTKNRVTYHLTNWAADNEICLALCSTSITSLKIGTPVWKDNTVIGASGNQGGWFDTLWHNGSYYEGVAITIKTNANGTISWVFCTIFGSALVMQYAWYTPSATLYKADDGANVISFTTSGITINNTILTTATFQCSYQNGAWSAITSGGDVRTYASYFVDQSTIYFGVAPAGSNTVFCIKDAVFG